LIVAEQGPEMFPLARCPGPVLIRSERANCFHTGLRCSGAVSRERETEKERNGQRKGERERQRERETEREREKEREKEKKKERKN